MAKRFPNRQPSQITDDLWEIRGEWSSKFGRRMLVIRLSDRRLVVYNAFELDEEEIAWLVGLGVPTWIVAPNRFHGSDAGWMASRFPEAELFVPRQLLTRFREQGLEPKDLGREFPSLPGLSCIPMEGTRIGEAALFHAPSKTLILCDLAFNMNDEFTGLERTFMRWNKVGGRFGPSRLARWLFTQDKARLLASFDRLLALDFDRVIVNHGEILPHDGKRLLRAGVEEIWPSS